MKNKLKVNILYNTVYQILILLVPFITSPYVSRVLHPEGLGTYSVTTAIAKYFWMFALLGMANYGNRTIAKARGPKEIISSTFWNLFFFQLIIGIIASSAFFLYIIIWGYQKYNIVILCQIPYLMAAVFEVSWFFYGTEQFRLMVVRNSAIKIATMISVFMFVRTENDVWIYALINTLSLLLGQLCLWPFVLKSTVFVKPNWTIVKSHLKPNIVLLVSVVAVSIYTLMDKIMIELLSYRAEVGYYENAEKILNMCDGIVGSIGAVMLPRISYLVGNNDISKVKEYLSKSMKYVMMLAIGISFGMAGISKEFAVVFFGVEFEKCGTLIAVICIAVLFYSWENILRTQYLLPNDKDKIFVKGTIYAALSNLILNALFIPHLGALGAVIGTVGAQIAAAFYQSFKVRRELPINQYIKGLFPSAFVGVLMISLCRGLASLFGTQIWTIAIQVLIGSILYVVLMAIILYKENDQMIMSIIQKIKKNI